MTKEQLLEIIKAVAYEQSKIVDYVNSMTYKFQEMKENAKITGTENELYKVDVNSGNSKFFRLTFKLGETKLEKLNYKIVKLEKK